jgi:hypothetical protein
MMHHQDFTILSTLVFQSGVTARTGPLGIATRELESSVGTNGWALRGNLALGRIGRIESPSLLTLIALNAHSEPRTAITLLA